MEIIVAKPKTEEEVKCFADKVYEYINVPDNLPRDYFFFPPETEAIIEKRVFKEKATGAVVATGSVRLIGRDLARVSYITVAESWRKRGLGRLMVQQLEILALKMGATQTQLSSVIGKERFYQRLGYTIVRPDTELYEGRVLLGTLMSKTLYKPKL